MPPKTLSQADTSVEQNDAIVSSETRQSNTTTRTISINMIDTLMELNFAGAAGGVWKPAEGRHLEVFGTDDNIEPGIDTKENTIKLQNVNIKKAELLQTHSTYPFPLAVNVSCLPKTEILESGEKCTFTLFPRTKNDKTETLFTASDDVVAERAWKQKYSEYNFSNLETHGVMDVKAAPYAFLKDTHPIVDVIRVNPDLIGDEIDRQTKIDGEWYKVSRDVISKCATAIRKEILSKVTTHDLTNFHVTISRPGGQEWTDLDDLNIVRSHTQPKIKKGMTTTDINDLESFEAERMKTTPFEFNARIKLTYEYDD